MKIPLLSTALAAVLGLALCGTAVNAQTTTTADTSTTAPATTTAKMNFGGKITAIDTGAGKVTVKSKKHDLTLKVDSSTKFKDGGSLADFAVGDHVAGSYTTDATGVMTAVTLNKHTPKTATPAASTTPAAQ